MDNKSKLLIQKLQMVINKNKINIQELFNVLDRDANGDLSVEEFSRLIRNIDDTKQTTD